MTKNDPLKESIQATVDRANRTAVTPQDMLEAKAFVNTFRRRPSLIDVSNHLQFDLQLPKEKTEAILLRYIGLIRTVEKGIPGTHWDSAGSQHLISDALLAAAAATELHYLDNTICFESQDLLTTGLRKCTTEGTA